MKITKVKYSRLISDHNYNNQSFGAESEVLDGETPEDVRADLVLWVDGILEKRGMLQEQEYTLRSDISRLEDRHAHLYRKVEELKEKHKWLVGFCEKHGIELEDSDLPF